MVRTLHALVAVLIGTLLASASAFANLADLRQQREGLRDSVASVSLGWSAAADEFFRSPVSTAHLLRTGMGDGSATISLPNLLAAVRLDADTDAAFVAWTDGRFLFAARDEDRGFRTRDRAADGTSEWRWVDGEFVETDRRSAAPDGFDPRSRPWYLPIDQGEESAWSLPYRFASSGNLGITYSVPVVDEADALVAVVGIDVRLSSLKEFLRSVRPRSAGMALLLDADRSVIAAAVTDDVDAEAVAAAIAIPTEANATQLSRVDDHRTAATRLVGPSNGWVLAVVADEADFVTAESRPVAVALRWLLIAVPVAIITFALLRPVLRRFESLYIDATRDELTGLLNRSAITDDLTRMLGREHQPAVVAIVDLDRFKPINDTWGHQQGDAALTIIAERLAWFADRFGFRAGRLGGDEFLLIGRHGTVDEADAAWPELLVEMRRPVRVGDVDVSVGASVGVTQIRADDVRSVEATLRRADRALYTVKRNGGDGWMRDDRLDHGPDDGLPDPPATERRSGSRGVDPMNSAAER